MMPKILVIGSNSFSGASFCGFALGQGAQVVGISRSSEPAIAFLPYKWRAHSQFQFYQMDLNQHLDDITSLINKEKPAYIINFAAQSMVAESWENPQDWFMTNTVSTIQLHDKLRKLNFLKRYVHISTPEVYGSCSGFVTEDNQFNPSTPYAVSRAAADMSLRSFYHAYQFPVVSTRAANVYGPGQQLYRIIPRTILFILLGKRIQLHGGGYSTRSFIHINDVSNATWKIMLGGNNGNTYHISTKDILSIRELVQKICKRLDRPFDEHVEIVGDRLGKDSAYHLDSSKIERELNWASAISLDDGLENCINWVITHFNELKNASHQYVHKS